MRFEATFTVKSMGDLHASFYPKKGGRGFGGVYVGKGASLRTRAPWYSALEGLERAPWWK